MYYRKCVANVHVNPHFQPHEFTQHSMTRQIRISIDHKLCHMNMSKARQKRKINVI